jgi:hypothetical protein
MWTLDYEADIASDLSVFHRVDDPRTIDGPRYFSLAVRLTAYAGVMAARAEKMRQDRENGPHGAPSAAGRPSSDSRPSHVPDEVAIAMLSDGWVEHVKEAEEA